MLPLWWWDHAQTTVYSLTYIDNTAFLQHANMSDAARIEAYANLPSFVEDLAWVATHGMPTR